ncbi:hypothetical protein HS088_TW09G00684 [Tripterygium wilfordii]|uniref:Uncharacterized protein n=1 Tax=Tripterygium wilfordii TaxID=458696 RepID=A0A7J7D8H9_TRIWF|nr:uncharacterized protein LOC120006309 [Tripterygium wilfordii]KAF5742633.1 hypothetical protein HS088_TW09G00684 [Tripterygium wilfordii]
MPVSGNEETGVKPVSWKSSDYIADIPIKKRRFPLMQPPPPPPEESSSSSSPLETDSNQNGQSRICEGTSVSNVSVPASRAGLSDEKEGKSDMEVTHTNVGLAAASSDMSGGNKNSVFEEEKQNIDDENGKTFDTDIKEKVVPADKADNIMSIAEKTELKLEPNEALAVNVGKETHDQHTGKGKSISERSLIFGNAELSLGLNNDNPSSVVGQSEEGSQSTPEDLEPISLNLFLSKGESSKGDSIQSYRKGPNLHANRSNWDLNTTMDSWGNSVGGAAKGQLTSDILSTGDGGLVKKPFICSPMVVPGDATEKKILVDSEHRSSFAKSSTLSGDSGQKYFPEDSLNLRLSPSCIPFNLSREPSCSSVEVDSGRVLPNISMLRGLSVSNLNMINRSCVKTEPSEDSIKHGLAGAKTYLMEVKSELNEKVSPEVLKSSNSCTLKLVDPRSIKSEPFLNAETMETLKQPLDHSNKVVLQAQEVGKPACSTSFSIRCGKSDVLEHSVQDKGAEVSEEVPKKACEGHEQVASEIISGPAGSIGNEQNVVTTADKTLKRPLDHSNKIVLQAQDVEKKPACSTNFSIRCGKSDVLDHSMQDKGAEVGEVLPKKAYEGHAQVASEIISGPAGPTGNEQNVITTADTEMTTAKNVDNPEQFRLQLTDEFCQEFCANGGGCVSDEEKINIPGDMLEEDSYGSDCESDGNHDLNVSLITEQNHEEEDYEDGEVREQLVDAAKEGPTYEKTEEKFIATNLNDKITNYAGLPGYGDPCSSHFGNNDAKIEDAGETNDDTFVDRVDTAHDGSTDKAADQDGCLQEFSTIGVPTTEHERKTPVQAVQKELLDISEGRVAEEIQEPKKQSDQGIDGSQGTLDTVPQASDDNIEKSIMVENTETALCKRESSLDGDNAGKGIDGGGNRSRIINLARSSNVSPPGNSRYMPGKLLSTQPGRERLTDIALERDNIHPQGRDESCNISSLKFTRERHQDQLSRNSRFNYGRGRGWVSSRGRGRVSGRGDSLNDDWETERDFDPGYYNGPTEFHLPRHKYASGMAEAEIGCDNYKGRKLLNDESPTFRRGLSIRRPPGGRNGPARSLQMIHRVPRNISPSRCMGDDGSEVVGLRNGEKFVRGFPDDGTDHELARTQQPYDGDGNFFRGNRNFSSAHRRGGFSRIRSKSPIRSRSPGSWSSPRRRSPDGFGGRPDLPHRRSGEIYRMGRMRSPDPPCYPGEMLMRRHGSPLYTSRPSNYLREVDSRRDHGQPRSVIPSRSTAGRVVLRNNRRFDIADPRERNDGDEFFAGPMHSSRFSELSGEASSEERRRFIERQGPVRSFRPPYDGTDGGSFHLNTEDGPRPFRLCPEDDPDFHERGNREFDRRITVRPGNVSRRTRGIEDEEGNYRHGGQVMYDNGFDDMSRVKRKRF